MNLNSSEEGRIESTFKLNGQLGNISISNERNFEYNEGDDVLCHSRRNVSEDYFYNNGNSTPLDAGEVSGNIALSGI